MHFAGPANPNNRGPNLAGLMCWQSVGCNGTFSGLVHTHMHTHAHTATHTLTCTHAHTRTWVFGAHLCLEALQVHLRVPATGEGTLQRVRALLTALQLPGVAFIHLRAHARTRSHMQTQADVAQCMLACMHPGCRRRHTSTYTHARARVRGLGMHGRQCPPAYHRADRRPSEGEHASTSLSNVRSKARRRA